jgi:FkbM family methyltransferase
MIKNYNLLGHEFIFEIHDDNELTSNIIRNYGCNIDMEAINAYNYLMRKGDYFLDIGANIGWQTVFASLIVGENGKVFSFEPDNKNFEVLKNNIKLNNLNNVTAVKLALAESEYVGELYSSKQNFGNHMLNPKFCNPEIHNSHCQVKVSTIDRFCEIHNIDTKKISLIKIDVEGSECRVLNGGSKFFENNRPNIILEYSPSQIAQCGFSVFDIFSFIDRNKYSPFMIEKIDINNPTYKLQPLNFFDLLTLTKNIMNTTEYRDILLLAND